jgi:hypothetical protein
MSKRTIALIITLFVITLALIVLAVYPITKKTTVSITPTPTASVAQTVLVFAPPTVASLSATATTSATPTYSMDVNVLTGKNKITAVQLELSYDPKALVNVDITPGSFFSNPTALLKTVDVSLGRISYALVVPLGEAGKQGTGTVATLTFKSLLATGETTTIKFLPKTQVAAEGVAISVLKSTIDTAFIGGLFTTPSARLNTSTNSAQ